MTVDAVYAMAHALHKILKEHCNDAEFSQCDALQPGPVGADLLQAIREVSFIGMQGTQVRAIPNFYFIFIIFFFSTSQILPCE